MRTIDWAKWSALAEIAGAIAILVTLFYLGTQTRYLAVQTQQNTNAIQASIRQAMLAQEAELLFKQMDYPFVSPAYPNRDLTADEQVQYESWLLVFLRDRENQWLQFHNGVIDEATWVTYRYPMIVVLSPERARSFWRTRAYRGEFDRGFVSEIDRFLGSVSATPQDEPE